MQDAIATAYPGIEVVPSTFPVTPSRLLAGQILSVIQMTAIVFFLFAERAAAMMGIQLSPDMARGLSEKRVGLCIGTWIIGNFMKNSLTSTGAFEIFYDGQKIFSKLDTGRLPSLTEINDGINALMASKQQ